MRLSTLLLFAIAGALSFTLFQIKYEVLALEDELRRVAAATVADQETIHILDAEWSHLNDPVRLRPLAERYLHAKPILPRQMVGFHDLPVRDATVEAPAADAKPAAPTTKAAVPVRDKVRR